MSRKILIEEGQIFGKLTIIKELERFELPCGQKMRQFQCMCDCGKITINKLSHLRKGEVVSCGCIRKNNIEIGKKINFLTIIKEVKEKKGRRVVLCKCDCGNIKEFYLNNLLSGQNIACGCKQFLGYEKHGLSRSRFYNTYLNISSRCNKNNATGFNYYGGRGIKCEWKTFEEFRDDMYESYLKHCEEFGEKETTIDRINVNGNYCKENCRWATYKEQANNTTRNKIIIYNGEEIKLSKLCNDLKLDYNFILKRLWNGWDIYSAVNIPKLKPDFREKVRL